MIIVVADDFTGAAEIGGIGLKYGLSVEIFTTWPVKLDADLVILATNMRSKSIKEAKEETKRVSVFINQQKSDWIFKKIDSVLRGHIIEETQVMMKTLNKKSSIIIPANPQLNRIIKGGIYYIEGKLIAETNFANDPEYSIDSSVVKEILSKNKIINDLNYRVPSESVNEKGIVVGEVKNNVDMDAWASLRNPDTLLVGSAGFFEAVLRNLGYEKKINHTTISENKTNTRLIICGSAYHGSWDFVRDAKERGFPVSYMSNTLFYNDEINIEDLNIWKDEIIALLNSNKQAIIAIGQPILKNKKTAATLKKKVAKVVKAVYKEIEITEFLIEGGATASEVLDLLEFTTLIPIHQYNQGVIRLNVKKNENISIVLKPGSYQWPEKVLSIN